MIDLGDVRHGVDVEKDPIAVLQAVADDLLIVASAIHRADDDDPVGRAVERASHRMNDALAVLEERFNHLRLKAGMLEAASPSNLTDMLEFLQRKAAAKDGG